MNHNDASPVRYSTPSRLIRQVDRRDWWLWAFAVVVTLVLTVGVISLTLSARPFETESAEWFNLREWVRGLAALVLLFDVYTVYQHLQLQKIRRQLAERDELFQLITENAADMIAVVDADGHRLYNSPAYQKVLGYSAEELANSSPIEQIHPDDRHRVLEAGEKARLTGEGKRLEYRMRHRDGCWRILESTASAIRNEKGQTTRLVIVNRDITERKRAEEMLAHNALHDSLTNLPNRVLLLDRLQRVLKSERDPGRSAAILSLDIDDFKLFNDSLGQSAGDSLLIQIAARLTACLRSLDIISRSSASDAEEGLAVANTLARPGGDEFTILLEGIRHPSDAMRVAERIQAKLAVPFVVENHQTVVRASIGISFSTGEYVRAEDLLRDAEIAMYRAKHAGKGRYAVFDGEMHAAALKRLTLESDLRKALELKEFRAYYQPIVSLENGQIVSFETLARWHRPEGVVLPAEFIAVADEIGIVPPMNRELFRQTCQQILSWQARFGFQPPLCLSANVSPKQFAQPDLASQIGAILDETGIDPQVVELEITETIAMSDAERSRRILSELKHLGVRLGIDDFGTGYSSLSRLQGFPVDTLKIDRSFVAKMDRDPETYEIVHIIITLAHHLGLTVIAEGTENESQVSQLKRLGCKLAQGYFFGRPADELATSELLLKHFRLAARTGH